MHGTTTAVLQLRLLLVPATDCVVSVYMFVWVLCGRAILTTKTWTIPIHTSFEIHEHPRSAAAVQQQRYNTSEPHIAYTAVYTTPPRCIPPARVYTSRAIKYCLNNHPTYHRGTLYTPSPAVSCLTITMTLPRYHLLGDTVTLASTQYPQVCERTTAYGTCSECGSQTPFHTLLSHPLYHIPYSIPLR